MTDQIAVLVLVVCFLLGVRSTKHLRAIHNGEAPPRNLITGAFYFVSLVVTVAAGYYGFLSARRVLGFEPIPGVGVLSVGVASAVLLIPVFLDWTVSRIRSGVSQIDRMEAQGDRIEAGIERSIEHSDTALAAANTYNAKIAAQGDRITAQGERMDRDEDRDAKR